MMEMWSSPSRRGARAVQYATAPAMLLQHLHLLQAVDVVDIQAALGAPADLALEPISLADALAEARVRRRMIRSNVAAS
jgi:hypothetical protein